MTRFSSPNRIHSLCRLALLAALAGCGTNSGTSTSEEQKPTPSGPTKPVTATDVVPAELKQALTVADAMDASSLTESYPSPAATALGYDATTAAGMDLISASSLSLSASELEALKTNGLVVPPRPTSTRNPPTKPATTWGASYTSAPAGPG